MNWWMDNSSIVFYIAIIINFILLVIILVFVIKVYSSTTISTTNKKYTNEIVEKVPLKNPLENENESLVETETIVYEEEIPGAIDTSLPTESGKEGYYKFKGLIREQLVCQTLEKLYNKGFPTVRPSFLVNPETGESLEYDCFNSELKIAAEHNGLHHYQFPNRYHKSKEEFEYQVRKDKYKKTLSDRHDIYLITVPYWVPTNSIPSWVEYYCPETVTTRQNIENLLIKHK